MISDSFYDIFLYIDKHIEDKITLNEIADIGGYSDYHFCRLFARRVGISPIRYVTLRKLQYALYDLSQGQKILDVAMKYGFESQEGFSKSFKNAFGYLPSKYPFNKSSYVPAQVTTKKIQNILGGIILTSQPIKKECMNDLVLVTEQAKRQKQKLKIPAHSMAFSSLMASLKTFLGLPTRLELEPLKENPRFLWDWDYYFHLTVSSEGFGLYYDVPHDVLIGNYWDGEPLKDCFMAEGIKYHMIADEKIKSRDAELNSNTISSLVLNHLTNNLPAILIYNSNLLLLATGFNKTNSNIIAYPFSDGISNVGYTLQKNSRLYDVWTEDLLAVLLVDGLSVPYSRKDIIIKALHRGYEILTTSTEVKHACGSYGFGSRLYDNWISYLEDDRNYIKKKDSQRYVCPEDFDLAERRAFTAECLKDVEQYFTEGALSKAYEDFYNIHNNMWKIHNMVTGDNNGKLLEKDTRNQIIKILNECKELDNDAAMCIKSVLNI